MTTLTTVAAILLCAVFQFAAWSLVFRFRKLSPQSALAAAGRQGPVTLLYIARDAVHNNAVALKGVLEALSRRP